MNVYKSAVRYYFAALLSLIAMMAASFALAAPTFPTLTGRVVDDAAILQPATKNALEQKLAQIEKESSDQLVVVTVKSLDGYEIEEYGYQLGRQWGIGQAKLNNGVLLIVAPNERKVRIEVGYGLEGTLTDALSHEIINDKIIPQFKAGKMEQGIIDGVNGIDEVLKLSPEEQKARAQAAQVAADKVAAKNNSLTPGEIAGAVIFIVILLLVWKFSGLSPLDLLIILLSSGGGGRGGGDGFGGGFGGGGGFSGGGGSFGGGGSSGSW